MQKLFPKNNFVAPKMPDLKKDLVRILIAEAPGEEESKIGEPLVGGSGRLLNKLLSKAGIDRDGLTLANCIQCRPPKNVFPTDAAGRSYISKQDAQQAIQHCKRVHIDPILKSRNWRRVDLLGDKPLSIIGQVSGGIGTLRGSPINIPGTGSKGIATYHPSYLMRDQSMLPVAVNDLMKSLEEPPEYYSPWPSLDEVKAFDFKKFSFDIECPRYRELGDSAPAEMVGLCARAGFAMCVPISGKYKLELKRIFSQATDVIGWNSSQFDLPKLRLVDIEISKECKSHDAMLYHHLLFPDLPHDLQFAASQFISKPAWKADKSKGWEPYCCRDTDCQYQVWQQLAPMLRKEKLEDLYWNVQLPMSKICLLMHDTGFKTDPNRIGIVRGKLIAERDACEKLLPEFLRTYRKSINKRQPAPLGTLGKSGKPVKYILVPDSETITPWRSSQVKQKYLFGSVDSGGLGCEVILDAKSGNITTGKIALDKIYTRTKNPAVKALRRLNQLDETITTFAKEEMTKVERVHPHFNVHGTATGRLSSSDPNLQNIPESARVIYVPSHPGWKIISVDFSGIENILTAWFAKDEERLKRLLVPGYSEHKRATELFFGIPYEEVVKDNSKDAPYHKAKTIVHGTDGGMGYKRIAYIDDMDLKEARELQDKWKKAIYPTIQWQQKIGNEAQTKGVLTNPFGRKRWLYTSSAYTEGVRTPAQSTAADVIFRCMIGLTFNRIGLEEEKARKVCPVVGPLPWPSRLLLSVHDELVIEAPGEIVDITVDVIKSVMTQSWKELNGLSFPVGVKTSDLSWGELD